MSTYSPNHGGTDRVVTAFATLQAHAARVLHALQLGFRSGLARWQAVRQERANSRALELVQNMFAHDPELAKEFRAALLRSE